MIKCEICVPLDKQREISQLMKKTRSRRDYSITYENMSANFIEFLLSGSVFEHFSIRS